MSFPDDPRDGEVHEIPTGDPGRALRFKYDKELGKWRLQDTDPDA